MNNQDDLKLHELQIKTEELSIKRWEAENKSYEMWNTYLRETRSRADGLMRAALLVSGGALTLAVSAFLRPDHPSLSPELFSSLKLAWILLALSMVGVFIVSLISLASNDMHGKRWGKWLKDQRRGELKQPTIANWATWLIGLLAFACLSGGLAFLTYVAINGIK
jgi:FtsH-binding integral membrane protein